MYVLQATMYREGCDSQPIDFAIATVTLPTSDDELESLLDEEARIYIAEQGDGIFDYAMLRYYPVANEASVVSCGSTYMFLTEENVPGCLPQASIAEAQALLDIYFQDWISE